MGKSGFGGSVKLTGESEYKKALQQITQNLREVSSEMKVVTSAYDKNDKSEEAVSEQTRVLNKQLEEQQKKLELLKGRYEELSKSEDADSVTMSKLRTEMNKAQADINKTTKAIDELGKESSETGKEIKKTGNETDNADKKFAKLGETAKAVGKVMATTVVAIGTLAVATGKKLWDATKQVAETGDEIDKQSQKLNISAENYQKLAYAMERSGADIEDFRRGMMTITNAIADTGKGIEGADSKFQRLGISLKDASGNMKSSEQVLLESIDALAQMGDETERNALAQDIFGRNASELNPLLNTGADGIRELTEEAEKYGMVLSNDVVKASAGFQDSLTKLTGTFNGFKNSAMSQLLPSMTMVMDGFSDLIIGSETASETIKQGIEQFVADSIPMVEGFVGTLATTVGVLLETVIPELIEMIPPLLEKMTPVLVNAVRNVLNSIVAVLPEIIPAIAQLIPDIIETLISLLPQLIKAGMQMLIGVANGFSDAIPELLEMLPDLLVQMVGGLAEFLPELLEAGVKLIGALIEGIIRMIPKLLEAIVNIGVELVKGLWEGIKSMAKWLWDGITGFFGGIVDGIKWLLGIHSPSTVFRDEIGKNLAKGIGMGFEDEMKEVAGQMQDAIPTSFDMDANIQGSTGAVSSFEGLVEAFKDALSQMTVEMDDETMGKFVTKTVADSIYA